jgi:hypothetical protein
VQTHFTEASAQRRQVFQPDLQERHEGRGILNRAQQHGRARDKFNARLDRRADHQFVPQQGFYFFYFLYVISF